MPGGPAPPRAGGDAASRRVLGPGSDGVSVAGGPSPPPARRRNAHARGGGLQELAADRLLFFLLLHLLHTALTPQLQRESARPARTHWRRTFCASARQRSAFAAMASTWASTTARSSGVSVATDPSGRSTLRSRSQDQEEKWVRCHAPWHKSSVHSARRGCACVSPVAACAPRGPAATVAPRGPAATWAPPRAIAQPLHTHLVERSSTHSAAPLTSSTLPPPGVAASTDMDLRSRSNSSRLTSGSLRHSNKGNGGKKGATHTNCQGMWVAVKLQQAHQRQPAAQQQGQWRQEGRHAHELSGHVGRGQTPAGSPAAACGTATRAMAARRAPRTRIVRACGSRSNSSRLTSGSLRHSSTAAATRAPSAEANQLCNPRAKVALTATAGGACVAGVDEEQEAGGSRVLPPLPPVSAALPFPRRRVPRSPQQDRLVLRNPQPRRACGARRPARLTCPAAGGWWALAGRWGRAAWRPPACRPPASPPAPATRHGGCTGARTT